jgi:hypothetical protein
MAVGVRFVAIRNSAMGICLLTNLGMNDDEDGSQAQGTRPSKTNSLEALLRLGA